MSVNTVILVGKPGCGKGTQARLLSEKTGYRVYGTGAAFREMAASGSFVGNKLKAELDAGMLMPETLAQYLLKKALLNTPNEEGLIFEATGRKLPETKMMHELNKWLGRSYKVIYIDVPEETLKERLTKRAEEEGRADDAADSIPKRFEEFNKYSVEAFNYYREQGTIVDVDGTGSAEETHALILEALK